MLESGLMKYLVSQNTDGLHRKSGVHPDKIAELHGNTNIERCIECGKDYLRDFRVRNAKKVHDHHTGRLCDDPTCGGQLKDTIINFKESLPEEELDNAFNHATCADLCLAMGSSLRVTPAADVPKEVFDHGGKLVIVNLQKTPLDPYAAIKINAKCDDVMIKLFQKLCMDIPKWKIIRHCEVLKKGDTLRVNGRDENHNYYSLFPKVDVKYGDKPKKTSSKEPHLFKLADKSIEKVSITLHFKGHYKEKPCKIEFFPEIIESQFYKLTFDPFTQEWEQIEPTY